MFTSVLSTFNLVGPLLFACHKRCLVRMTDKVPMMTIMVRMLIMVIMKIDF